MKLVFEIYGADGPDGPTTVKLSLRERLIFAIATTVFARKHPRMFEWYRHRAASFGRHASFAFPRSADDKFLWRKALDRDPRFIRLCDKLEARVWVAAQGVDLSAPEVLWIGSGPEEMPGEMLTEDVIIKTNHSWQQLIYVADGLPERPILNAQLAAWLASDHSRRHSEWGYRDIPRRVFLERRVGAPDRPLEDWKFYTCGRRIERIVRINRSGGRSEGQVFEPDANGNFIKLNRPPGVCERISDAPVPAFFDQIIEWARRLGEPFDQMRVDFMSSDEDVWVGEMTVYNQRGLVECEGHDPAAQISRAWDLRQSWFLNTPQSGFWSLYAKTLRKVLDRAGDADDLPPA